MKIGWFFSEIWQGVCRNSHIGRGCSGSDSSGSSLLCLMIRIDVVLVSWRRKLTVLCGRRFRIGVARLEELLDALDCIIGSIKDICVRYRSVDELIVSCVLNILLYVFYLEVHRLRV